MRAAMKCMKRSFCLLILMYSTIVSAQTSNAYQPTEANIAARSNFQDMKFGMFIHWGLSSVLADGEWVMNNRNIKKEDYTRLLRAFNPVDFDAAKWVSTAKNAGMKYIVFITRHHDGFSNWDTKYSDWKITNTPYGKDVLKLLSEECKKQGMKLGLYYSLLDWYRDDYPFETGRTGHGTGRTGKGDYASYLEFMKNQLTELLTNYGDILSIWFDGHWDQTNPEGQHDRTSRIDWKYDEIYGLIHKLQPQCLIGNNHHLAPIPGEDFQMFERDLPGENKSGLSFQKASEHLPLEACETINGSWGYNITDRNYKTIKEVIQLQVGAAGRNANLLLNIGPMPGGTIQPEFVDTLAGAGKWFQKFGESIYGTRGSVIPPQEWGVVTKKDNNVYMHVLKQVNDAYIFIPNLALTVKNAVCMNNGNTVKFRQIPEGVFVYNDDNFSDAIDNVIKLTIK
jgi:alpha-L-fucosidase